MQEKISWGIMFIIGVLFVVMGFEGSFGKVVGCVFTPAKITQNVSGEF